MTHREIFKYEKDDPGPYRVLFKEENKKKHFIEDILVGQKLAKQGYKNDLVKIERTSKKVVEVTFRSYDSANKVIDNEELKKEYTIFIVKKFIFVDGYVKINPEAVEWDDEEFGIINQLKSENDNVHSVKRLTYKKKNESSGVKETRYSYKTSITFRAKKLPKSISVFRVIKKVFPFINKLRFCKFCGNYGHITELCHRAQEAKIICSNCFTVGHATCDTIKCKHCKGKHQTNADECSFKQRQQKINKTMSINNVGYREARKLVINPNYYADLEDESEFPSFGKANFSTKVKVWPKPKSLPKQHPEVKNSQSSKRLRSPQQCVEQQEPKQRKIIQRQKAQQLDEPEQLRTAQQLDEPQVTINTEDLYYTPENNNVNPDDDGKDDKYSTPKKGSNSKSKSKYDPATLKYCEELKLYCQKVILERSKKKLSKESETND
jgi:hypothetical protein